MAGAQACVPGGHEGALDTWRWRAWRRSSYAAEGLLKAALAKARREKGGAHPDTLACINIYGLFLWRVGRFYGEAEPLYREALAGYRRVLGDAHQDTLSSVNNLALLLQAKADLLGAEPLYREALAGSRRLQGDAHPGTLTSVNNLALLLQD